MIVEDMFTREMKIAWDIRDGLHNEKRYLGSYSLLGVSDKKASYDYELTRG